MPPDRDSLAKEAAAKIPPGGTTVTTFASPTHPHCPTRDGGKRPFKGRRFPPRSDATAATTRGPRRRTADRLSDRAAMTAFDRKSYRRRFWKNYGRRFDEDLRFDEESVACAMPC